MPVRINEIFCSIQGESTWSGLPCIFIRLTGCNLRCTYCDTQYAYDEGVDWSVISLIEHLGAFRWERVCLTGGEPLLQDSTPTLITELLDRGYEVSVETNGSLDIGDLDRRCVKVMDLKCPSSAMMPHNHLGNLEHLAPHDQVKFVIANRDDFDFACDLLPRIHKKIEGAQILFSPSHDTLTARRLARWILDDLIDARLQTQLHKQIWPEQERGV